MQLLKTLLLSAITLSIIFIASAFIFMNSQVEFSNSIFVAFSYLLLIYLAAYSIVGIPSLLIFNKLFTTKNNFSLKKLFFYTLISIIVHLVVFLTLGEPSFLSITGLVVYGIIHSGVFWIWDSIFYRK